MADSEGVWGGGGGGGGGSSIKSPIRDKIIPFSKMENFQKNQEKITNNQVQFTNPTPFVNLNPLSRNLGSAPSKVLI